MSNLDVVTRRSALGILAGHERPDVSFSHKPNDLCAVGVLVDGP
jgi:hypothetical protein